MTFSCQFNTVPDKKNTYLNHLVIIQVETSFLQICLQGDMGWFQFVMLKSQGFLRTNPSPMVFFLLNFIALGNCNFRDSTISYNGMRDLIFPISSKTSSHIFFIMEFERLLGTVERKGNTVIYNESRPWLAPNSNPRWVNSRPCEGKTVVHLVFSYLICGEVAIHPRSWCRESFFSRLQHQGLWTSLLSFMASFILKPYFWVHMLLVLRSGFGLTQEEAVYELETGKPRSLEERGDACNT